MTYRQAPNAGTASLMRLSFLTAASLVVCGCTSFPKQSTGQFNARNGDFIVLKRNGALYWSPLAKTDSRLMFVGTAVPDQEHANTFRLRVPSASRFPSPTIRFSPDSTHGTVTWGSYIGEGDRRAGDRVC